MSATEITLMISLFVCGMTMVSDEFPSRHPDGTISHIGIAQQAWVGVVVAGVPFGIGRFIEWVR